MFIISKPFPITVKLIKVVSITIRDFIQFHFISENPTVSTNCSSSVTRNEGQDLVCLCQGEGGNPPANVTWYDKTGKIITEKRENNKTLELRNLSVTDSGSYKCVAECYPDEKYRDEVAISITVRGNIIVFCRQCNVLMV